VTNQDGNNGLRGERQNLLIELGCEELPPRALDGLRQALFDSLSAGLQSENIDFDPAASRAFSTPRRLAMLFSQVAHGQPDRDQQRRGPALAAAFDEDGQATGAATGFAHSVGTTVDELQTLETDQGSWLVAQVHIPGKSLGELLFPLLQQAIRKLPIPRPMRWSSHEFSFVRPVHWLVVMHGKQVLEGRLLGLDAGRETRGHRIHAPGPHLIKHPGHYLSVLKSAFVMADQDDRKSLIRQQLQGLDQDTLIDAALLDEVNNLVEWPVAIKCSFDSDFLSVPHRALIASMQDHQKFFPVGTRSEPGKVTNQFIAVANLVSEDEDQVRQGFERVVRPRLADARFFLQQDQKQPLDAFLPTLNDVVFHKKIGTLGDKTLRIARISEILAEVFSLDSDACARGATLSKCDLMTQMVGEFPELQGVMGKVYALHSGEAVTVADAIEQHYLPRFAGDAVPASPHGQVVGIADRADTLVAIFSAGMKPSGSKDPFALRRTALGLVKILLEAAPPLALTKLLDIAANELTVQGVTVEPAVLADVYDFISERARSHFRETAYDTALVNAAMASDWSSFPDLAARLNALTEFMGQESGSSLAAANKRIGNILRKADFENIRVIDEDKFVLDEEARLFEEVIDAENTLKPLLSNSDYGACLNKLSLLRPAVDRFFDSVMVMDEDADLRNNRLSLLSRLKALFDQIADLSVLV